MTTIIEDGSTIIVRLPSGQLVRFSDIRVGRIEMPVKGSSYGRGPANLKVSAELYFDAIDVGYIDPESMVSRDLHSAISELAESVGAEGPGPLPAVTFLPIEQRPVTSSPIGPMGIPTRRFEPDPGVSTKDPVAMSREEFERFKHQRGLR